MRVYGGRADRQIEFEGKRYAQAREIVAARSKAEALRLFGPRGPRELAETRNELECELALANPGTVFYRPINAFAATPIARAEG